MNEREHPGRPGAGDPAAGGGHGQGARPDEGSERLRDAAARLEAAAQELAISARNELSDAAARLIDDVANRLRDVASPSAGGPGVPPGAPAAPPAPGPDPFEASRQSMKALHRANRDVLRMQRRMARRQARWARRSGRRPLRRGSDRMVAGVCSGLAARWQVDTWVVRCAAVTGMIFMPQIMFIAYWVVYFRMDPPDAAGAAPEGAAAGTPASQDHTVVAPEFGPRLSPRTSLGEARAAFDRIELKLRRMESYVTSSRFTLDRELAAIDRRGTPPAS